ncbi:MAG TPA: 6,7-dimethyl-8-ribityllumazine synthase [Candidatus Acidoferrales bacterium]|nr:6,7-dimethyl-8-ribityllumazine synthase [Candidatus Acidoferrales bacterium]
MPDKTPEKSPGKLRPTATQGELSAAGLHFGIVVGRFNSFITDRLLAGALDALQRAGATEKQIELVRVPGSLEIPVAAKKLGKAGRCDAIICIGCVIRGETSHFEHVSSEVARGVQIAQLDTGVPMAFCVLTCETLEQAIDRAGLKSGNKGFDAGLAAIEMANLLPKLAANPRSASSNSRKSKRRASRPGTRREK